MEKDSKTTKNKKESSINSFQNSLETISSKVLEILEKIVSKINKIDPRDNTKQRVVTSIILIPIALYAIFYSKSLFFILVISLTILMTVEWITISKSMSNKKRWLTIGFLYILIPVYSVIKIRLYDVDILFWMFAVIWATDIFAFFAGKILSGPKLAPNISPNKTWTGLAGGVVASIFIGLLSSLMFQGGIVFFVIVSVLLSVIEQISDLVESKFKRIFGVKDSGNIIPGHGGVLDRLDGMMLVAPTVLILITIFAENFGGK